MANLYPCRIVRLACISFAWRTHDYSSFRLLTKNSRSFMSSKKFGFYNKKSPDRAISIRGYPFLSIGMHAQSFVRKRTAPSFRQVFWLPDHSASSAFPIHKLQSVAFMLRSSPVTAAGPSPIPTGFPLKLIFRAPVRCCGLPVY